ncbi:MAG: hypothetical protein HZB86_02920 [Deltaproteobacteria bacterium]|nr:hypothetical protein [Deltaproteobacteria bacterium]
MKRSALAMKGVPLGKAAVLLFLAAFSWPFLGVIDAPATILGIPSFLAGIFLFWAVLVYALFTASRRTDG